MAKIVQLTDNSWLLRSGDAASGLLFRNTEGYLYMNPKTRSNFKTLEDVEKKFGKLKLVERESAPEVNTLNGFPVKHANFAMTSENPPLYVKDGGKTEFAAGYWGLHFNQGWTQAFCPKKKTLDDNEHVGPFKNRLEMINHLAVLNNNMNLKNIDAEKK